MTSNEIRKQSKGSMRWYSHDHDGCNSAEFEMVIWLKEIAYQLAVLNEKQGTAILQMPNQVDPR